MRGGAVSWVYRASMTETRRKITYRGPAAYASMQMLKEDGATVEWEPPKEERGLGEMAQEVVVTLVASGTLAGIKAALERFQQRTEGRFDVTDEDDGNDGESQS